MENSTSSTEANQSFKSPPRRRRSTFFERESTAPQPSENRDIVKKTIQTNEKHVEELSQYYDKLLTEKQLWKKEVTDRQNKYHDLRKQYQLATKAPSVSRMSYSALTDEDIEFLNAKPNISKLVEKQQKLHKSAIESFDFYRRACELDTNLLDHCEDRINKITDYILENSSVE